MILAQKLVSKMKMDESAAVYIQSAWRKHRVASWYKNLRQSVITLQAHSRGYLARQKFSKLKNTVILHELLKKFSFFSSIIIFMYYNFRERVFQLLKLVVIQKNLVKKNCMTLSK